MLRTFIAIDLPTTLLQALTLTQTQVREYLRVQSKDAALRWSSTQNLHLTLRFLGDTTPDQRATVTARLRQLTAQVDPFALRVDTNGGGLGGFPNLRQPRVLWAGVEGELAALRQLQGDVETVAQGAGFAPETQPYTPHLTLARAARTADRRTLIEVGKALRDYADHAPPADVMHFTVDHLTLYQSELGAGGSRYTVLAMLPFAGV